ncbi:MAG TPA: hypothetical protein VGM39_11155 [Kofleriaceae bacterium]|jgi:hypothetical protein
MRRILWLGVLLVGCGGDSASSLSCDYLASADNCFKTTASTAASCLPTSGMGVLAADSASCTYASGQVITFTPPLALPLPTNPTWNFTVTTSGTECLRYVDHDGGFDLTVGGDTVSEDLSGSRLELTCPDGTQLASSKPLDLLKCPGTSFGDLPGNTSSSSATSVMFGLLNAGGADTLTVFNCQR